MRRATSRRCLIAVATLAATLVVGSPAAALDAPVIFVPPEDARLFATEVPIAGFAEPGSFVTVFEGTTSLGGTPTSEGGFWFIELPFDPGTHTVVARATLSAETSADSEPRTFIVRPPHAIFSDNLIRNGDAEAGPGATDDTGFELPPFWSFDGAFTAMRYGAATGEGGAVDLPTAATPGPVDRGDNLFVAGSGSVFALQTIDVSAAAETIDAGGVTYELSGYLGGSLDEGDATTVDASFEVPEGPGAFVTIGPVSPEDRGSATALLFRSATGTVPSGTRTISVFVEMSGGSESYNEASADNLALYLHAPSGPDTGATVTGDNLSSMVGPGGRPIFAMPSTAISAITVTGDVTCPGGGPPADVLVLLDGTSFTMTEDPAGSGRYSVTVPPSGVRAGRLLIAWICDGIILVDDLGDIVLYDPAGLITQSGFGRLPSAPAAAGTPIPGAQVQLYVVPSFHPASPGDTGPGTCHTLETRPGTEWEQAPPADPALSRPMDPLTDAMVPPVNPFLTNPLGLYGWFVPAGCYFVKVTKPGYEDAVSAMVGSPPDVTDLDLALDSLVFVTFSAVTSPVTLANRTAAEALGTTRPGATVDVTVSGGAVTTPPAPATVSGSGDFQVTGIDLTAVPDGAITYTATAADPDGNISTATIPGLKDTVPPSVTLEILDDGDGLISEAEAGSGVAVGWTASGSGPPVTLTASEPGRVPPGPCVFGGLARSGTRTIDPSCFDVLADGVIDVVVEGTDTVGNIGRAARSPELRRTFGAYQMVVLAGASGYANAHDTNGGARFPVRFDLDPASVAGPVTASITVRAQDGRAVDATRVMSPSADEARRTLSVDVRAFGDGPVTVTGSLIDGIGHRTATTQDWLLDLNAPGSTWGVEDGSMEISLHVDGVTLVPVRLHGTSSDVPPTTEILDVFIMGENLDTGETVHLAAVLTRTGPNDADWQLDVPLSLGTWRLSAQAIDGAGNLEPVSDANTIEIFVLGAP